MAARTPGNLDQRECAGPWLLTSQRVLAIGREGRHLEALEGYRAVLRLAKRSGDRDGEVVATQNVATAYHDLGRTTLARRWATKALDLVTDDGPAWRRQEMHRLLGIIEMAGGNIEAAAKHFSAARDISAAMGDDWRAATLSADVGALLIEVDRPRATLELDRAYETLLGMGDVDWMSRVEMNRAMLASLAGQRESPSRRWSAPPNSAESTRRSAYACWSTWLSSILSSATAHLPRGASLRRYSSSEETPLRRR